LLDQVEAFAELAEEGQVMGKRVFHQITMELDRLEREGYFDLIRAGSSVADRFAHRVKAEDVESFGNRMIDVIDADVPEKVSLITLLRAMSDQRVRRGLYRSMNLLKVLGD
jgi:glutamate/tyrosine decarboxylase-like PLP-dependent enzyme